ncbi:MAG: sulfatase-like hydrolase/transferase [Chromatiaceae bacterium]|nr:sulfatase-like hydrolase/transferase [Chromatiaceae bacterium]MCP5448790.1 sulfatase-like hydrolase/transferase [Chromatiaceae bacterium]
MSKFGKQSLWSSTTKLHLTSVLIVVCFLQILELLLLQRKYDLFTGGFLQPYSYLSWTDRVSFIGLGLWMDLVFIGTLGTAWFWFTNRRVTRPLVAAYFFVFSGLSIIGIWLAVKFKILAYFNDTINFLIVQNLGGGNIVDVLAYITNEATMYGITIVSLSALFWIGLHIVRQVADVDMAESKFAMNWLKVWVVAPTVILTVAIVWLVNSDFSLRYGLEKKSSYEFISNMLNQLTDIDRDGYGLFTFPPDPLPLDPVIYPGALDLPDNGIDEDGYGGDFHWTSSEPDPLTQLIPKAKKNILLVVLESTRSDLLGVTLNNKPVTPNLTALANQGSSIDYSYSHTGYTVTSLTALFNRSLSSGYRRIALADFLEQSGYSLSFISGQDESFGDVATTTGMNAPGRYLFDARSALQDRVYPSKDSGSLRLSEERVLQEFKSHTSKMNWDNPQFIYTNLQAAHFPYSHPGMPALIIDQPIPRSKITVENQSWLESTYWNAVAVADRTVGSMIMHLKELGVYEQTLVMIVADHGESLFDDSFLGHGHALNQSQTRIPLIINQPGIDIHTAVGQIDIANLLVQLATGQFNEADWNNKEKPVLQIVGSLDNPQLIGIVSYGEIRTILDLRTRRVYFSDLDHWDEFDLAWKNPTLKPRIQTLIELWERTRWEDYLSGESTKNQQLNSKHNNH